MSFDPSVPPSLKTLQLWFGEAIHKRADDKKADIYIVPSKTLSSLERLGLYQNQFWNRLLGVLRDISPLLCRLFGVREFNQKIGFPYLLKYLPDHWSIDFAANRLPSWIEEEYRGGDRELILDAARLDWGYSLASFSKHFPSFAKSSPENPFLRKLCLQPHLQLLTWEYDLISFRDKLLEKEADYWVQKSLPKLKKGKLYYFALYRRIDNQVVCESLTPVSFHLLKQFQFGSTLEKAINQMAQEPLFAEELGRHIQEWMQEWVVKEWLIDDPRNAP